MRPSDLSGKAFDAYRMWHDVFGLSEAAALKLVAEDFGPAPTDHDRVVGMFQRVFGLSEEAAGIAARGRGGSSFRAVSEVSSSVDDWAAKARAALSEMSDAECDAMLEEQRRRRKGKKTTTTSKAPVKPAGSRSTVISERSG